MRRNSFLASLAFPSCVSTKSLMPVPASHADFSSHPNDLGFLDVKDQGGGHGAVLDLEAGASAPPLFGLRYFLVELAGLRGVFVARLPRGNFFVCTSGSFFLATRDKPQCKMGISVSPLL